MKVFYEIEFKDGSRYYRTFNNLTGAKNCATHKFREEQWEREKIAQINFVVEHIGGVARFVVCKMNSNCEWENVQ